MSTFDRLRDIVCGIFRVHPSAVREDVTLAALTGQRDTKKPAQLSDAVFKSFGVNIDDQLSDCNTLGAIAEAIDEDLARSVSKLQAAE